MALRPVDETERIRDRNITDDVSDDVDLPEDTVDESGAVAATDDELLDPRPKDAAVGSECRSALVPLGVDDPDAGGGDRDVVDVRPRPGDAAVAQDGDGLGRECIEARTVPLLADRTRGRLDRLLTSKVRGIRG